MAGLVLGVSCCIVYSFGFELNSLAMPLGAVGYDYVNLNVDSLWSGGPFENASYVGGNPASSILPLVQELQQTIFEQGYGDYTDIMGNIDNYGE
jgi:alpha-L-fucosidase 2